MRAVRVHQQRLGGRSHHERLRLKLGDDASNPTYIINEPRVGYCMPKAETQIPEEA